MREVWVVMYNGTIDYCTIFSGPNAGILARMSYNSLFKTSDVSNVNFHVITKDINHETFLSIVKLISPDWQRQVSWINVPFGRYGCGTIADVAYTSDYVVTNCGYSKWCILAHFDMMYKKDFISLCREKMTDDHGMLGQHERFLLVNRQAYSRCNLKFNALSGFVAIPAWPPPQNKQYKLRYKDDPRVANPLPPPHAEHYDYKPGDVIPIRGFDTGELLELEMFALGLKVEPLEFELREYIEHFGGGGSYYGDSSTIPIHRERALKRIEEYGL